jgi:hypothetical protein
LELPKTAMAVTKKRGRFLKPKALDTMVADSHETKVCRTNMMGMIPSSGSLSGVNWEASFAKTGRISFGSGIIVGQTYSGRA